MPIAAYVTMTLAGVVVGALAAAPAAGGAPPAGPPPTTRPAEPARTWLKEIVVTATRRETEAFAAPYVVDVVDVHGFADNRLYRTTAEAVKNVPGVMVQKTAHAQGSPYIRGFTGFRTLMLVDGIRLNNSVFRDGPNEYWNLVDPLTMDRLEIVKGPASVLYGSDAIGGAVNAISRRATGYGEGLQWHRQLYYEGATAERSNVGRGEINVTCGNWLGVLVGGDIKDYGDLQGGPDVGRQDKTGYDQCSGDIRVDYRPDADSQWTFAHYNLYQNDAWRSHKTIYGFRWHGTTVGDERQRVIDQGHSLTYLRYRRKNMGSCIDVVDLTASFQTLTEQTRRVRSDYRHDKQGFDVDTYGLAAQFETPSAIGRWTYGLEWYHDEVTSFADTYNADGSLKAHEIQGPVADDASYDLLGLYVQDQIPLCERLELTLGGRYTYARADAARMKDPATGRRTSLTEDWEAVVGSARLSWLCDPREHWNLFGGVSQGFRAPNLSDLTRLDSARSHEIETPSPGLEPERFVSYEAGVKASYDGLAAQASYFYTDIRDMIVRTPTGRTIDDDVEVTKKNSGDGYVQGVEFGASYRFCPQWTLLGSFAWTYGEVETYPTSAPVLRSEPISRLMPVTTRVGLRWDHPDGKLWAETSCTFAGTADKLPTADKDDTQRIPPGGTPGYTVVDLRAGWKVMDGLDVWGAVENLTNQDYRVHGSGVNEPGIDFKLGVRWRF